MKKLDFTKMNSFGYNAIGMVLAIIIAFCFAIPFGIGYAIDWVSDLILYTVIIEVSLDLVGKFREQKSRVCWQYFVGIGLILLADWSFMAAAHEVETKPWAIWLSITAGLGMAAGYWFNKVVAKAYAKKLGQ